MNGIQIKAASRTNHIVVLTADRTCQNCALEAGRARAAGRIQDKVVVRVQSFFEPTEENVATADLFRPQRSGRNRVETKHVLPADLIRCHLRFMAITTEM